MNAEYQEDIVDLQKLYERENPPVHLVQQLLDKTRLLRNDWIINGTDLSIHDIVGRFPPLKKAQWVSNIIMCLS